MRFLNTTKIKKKSDISNMIYNTASSTGIICIIACHEFYFNSQANDSTTRL